MTTQKIKQILWSVIEDDLQALYLKKQKKIYRIVKGKQTELKCFWCWYPTSDVGEHYGDFQDSF